MTTTREVFVLVPEAVYSHGVVGVFGTEEEARAAAERIWPETDGHHDLVIYRCELGEVCDMSWAQASSFDVRPMRQHIVGWEDGRPVRAPVPPRIAMRSFNGWSRS